MPDRLPTESDIFDPNKVPAAPLPHSYEERLRALEVTVARHDRALAVGSERFKRGEDDHQAVENLERDLTRLTIVVEKLALTVGLLRSIIFGGIATVLLTVLGAVLVLVVNGAPT